MAATMIHLLPAHKLKPNACGLYYAGNFAPDAIDMREGVSYVEKGKWHLRDAPDREAALKEFYLQIDRSCPFQEGYFIHLYFDMWWDIEIISKYQNYDCPDWFSMYRNENSAAGIWVYKNMPWIDDVVEKFRTCPANFKTPMPQPTKDEIINFNNFMFSPAWKRKYQIDSMENKMNNVILTPSFMESYIDTIATRYNIWVSNL